MNSYTRITLELLTLPSRTKTEDLFIILRFNFVKVFTVEIGSFFRLFEPRQEKRKRLNSWKEPWRFYTIISFPFESEPIKTHQNEVMIAKTEANSLLDLGWFNEGYLLLTGLDSETFFGRTIVLRDDAVIDCLIKGVQLASDVDHSSALNRPCLRAWTQLTYFLSFSTSSLFRLHCAMSRIFISASVQNAKGVSIISEWPSYYNITSEVS